MIKFGWLQCLLIAMTVSLPRLSLADDSDSSVDADAMPSAMAPRDTPPSSSVSESEDEDSDAEEIPWDYRPYQVLVWLVSDDLDVNAESVDASLRSYLQRDFGAVWRLQIEDAPAAVRTAAERRIDAMSYDLITAADPILAVKRDHPDAVRIRIAKNVGQYVSKVYATDDRIAEVKRRGALVDNETLDGVEPRLEAVDADALAVGELWTKPETEALLISRGMAMTLTDPEAKLITPKVSGLVGETVEQYDKILIARITTAMVPHRVSVVEFDTLMRHFGPVATTHASTLRSLHVAIGQGLARAFAPVVRIENAGQKSAVGLLRAGGLILEENRETSPAFVRVGDVLEPMVRKNDRNGKPIVIGPMDWAYLLVKELAGHQGRNVNMDFHAGRTGGLQGRKNKRTFRVALKVRPFDEGTTLRLHLQKNPNFPLIGYELYEKNLETSDMTFIGRTDWDGRLWVEKTDQPLRLLYVKNGGAVLARLPIVPGLYSKVVADLSGDDIRLQAEAYIRGVQNSIVDLVAIRELFKARIRLRLERGEMEKAEDLLNALRDQPSTEDLFDQIGKKHDEFINRLGSGMSNQRRKVDEMFSTTRELLSSHITPQLVRELEADYMAASKNGGKLPAKSDASESDDVDEEGPAEEGQAEEAQTS